MSHDQKRQNFNVDADQLADLESSRLNLNAATVKDAMLRAARLVNSLARELRSGGRLVVLDKAGNSSRLVFPDLELAPASWTYLCERPHPWRKQLYIKGRKLLASNVWSDMVANDMTAEAVAADRDLPAQAVHEAVRYCEQNLDLITMEAQEEKTRLATSGISLGD